jgi:hypothetical protein
MVVYVTPWNAWHTYNKYNNNKKIIRMSIHNKQFLTEGLIVTQSRPILIDT